MNHKITINNIEIELTEEQIKELHGRLQDKGEKYFFPKGGEEYYSIFSTGVGQSRDLIAQIERGVFRTLEQAKKEDEKKLALVRLWKWVQENGLYCDDWNRIGVKHHAVYRYETKTWKVACYIGQNCRQDFLFPYFKTQKDCQKFIDNNLSDLNLFV